MLEIKFYMFTVLFIKKTDSGQDFWDVFMAGEEAQRVGVQWWAHPGEQAR